MREEGEEEEDMTIEKEEEEEEEDMRIEKDLKVAMKMLSDVEVTVMVEAGS